MCKISKDLDTIQNIVEEFLSPFELTCGFSDDFAYYPIHNYVTVSLVTIDRSSKNFLSFVQHEFKDVTADVFLWSLLHEVGHHETWDELTDEEIIISKEMKDSIEENENIDKDVKDKIYFNIPDEYAATEWAANYMIEHSQEVKEFWNKLQPFILDIYKKYNIER